MRISFHLNGRHVSINTIPERRLADILREDYGLVGTHPGCYKGTCGFCTVLMDGNPIYSCLLPAFAVREKTITTIEGFLPTREAQEILKGFQEAGCLLPEYVLASVLFPVNSLLETTDIPDEEDIEEIIRYCHWGPSRSMAFREGIIIAAKFRNRRKRRGKRK